MHIMYNCRILIVHTELQPKNATHHKYQHVINISHAVEVDCYTRGQARGVSRSVGT